MNDIIQVQEFCIDKSSWPEGLWLQEPDYAEWTDSASGLTCRVIRNPHGGNFCGYVGVSREHPLHEVGYSEVSAEVHGGLTFSDLFPDRGDVWWLGFDCAHYADLRPAAKADDIMSRWFGDPEYRTFEYVTEQCRELARQIKEATM